MTAALGIAIVVLALAAMYFAGEAREWEGKFRSLELSERAAIVAMDVVTSERKHDRLRYEATLALARRRLDEEVEANAMCNDPDVRRARLRNLGRVLQVVPGEDRDPIDHG